MSLWGEGGTGAHLEALQEVRGHQEDILRHREQQQSCELLPQGPGEKGQGAGGGAGGGEEEEGGIRRRGGGLGFW